ncbi:MAG: hypothetical protein H6839_14030 [Planctomycetes bacterium]|nr:hypothetical protein [Planctomycetota bacterium]
MTHVDFFDRRAVSPNGLYEVDALSAENGKVQPPPGLDVPEPGPFGYQRMFRYQCRDAGTGELVWERWQPEREESPEYLFVSDEGECGVFCMGEVFVIDAKGRRAAGVTMSSTTPVFSGIGESADYVDEHIHDTSAGQMWSCHSIAYFLSDGGARYFVVVPWWGRRIVLNISAGEWCRGADYENAAGVEGRALREFEAAFAIKTIAQAVETPELMGTDAEVFGRGDNQTPKPLDIRTTVLECGTTARDFRGAVFNSLNIVHEQGLADAGELVAQLEKTNQLGGVDSSVPGYRFVRPQWIETFTDIRCVAQRTLRLLGRAPSLLPGYMTRGCLQKGDDATFDGLEPGASMETVRQVAGAPSYMREHTYQIGRNFFRDYYWEYDFGVGAEGRTVILAWLQTSKGSLTRIDYPKVPIWLDPAYRRRLVDP